MKKKVLPILLALILAVFTPASVVFAADAAPDNLSITEFKVKISNVEYNGVIDEDARTITVNVPWTSATSFAATIPAVKVAAGSSVAQNSLAIDGTNTVDFTANTALPFIVTAANSSTRTYNVTIKVPESTSDKNITKFVVNGAVATIADAPAKNDVAQGTITIEIPYPLGATYDATSTFTPSELDFEGQLITPVPTAAQALLANYFDVLNNVSSPSAKVTYTVKAQDNSTKVYTVNATLGAPSTAADITKFSVNTGSKDYDGVISGTNIKIDVPYNATITGLTPAIELSTGAVVTSPSGAQDFDGKTVSYVVTAQDKTTTKTYNVTITKATATSVRSLDKLVLWDGSDPDTLYEGVPASNGTVTINVPYDVDLGDLEIDEDNTEYQGATLTLSPNGAISGADFDAATDVVLRVTAQDGNYTDYTVKINQAAPRTEAFITKYTVTLGTGDNAKTFDGAITEIPATTGSTATPASGKITVALPYLFNGSVVDVATVKPVFEITGQKAVVGTTDQVSGSTQFGAASGSTVNYVVWAEDYVTSTHENTKTYAVTITRAQPTATTDITKFTIDEAEGTITGTNIDVEVPYGTDVTKLTPVIEINGATVAPASEVEQNFTTPITYTVTAENGAAKQWKVTVKVAAPSADKDITSFTLAGAKADITGSLITVEVPYGTALTALTPDIEHNGVDITPTGAQNFSKAVTYTVTAQDKTTKDYTVIATVADKPAANSGWDHSTGVWKYFKADGSAQTGWFYDSSYKAWFYFTSAGNMVSGKWLHDTDGSWYYLSGNGKMVTGKQTINGKAYSFKGNGVWIA
jgi:hypothetical protein